MSEGDEKLFKLFAFYIKLLGVKTPLIESCLLGKYVDLFGFCKLYPYFANICGLYAKDFVGNKLGADLSKFLLLINVVGLV